MNKLKIKAGSGINAIKQVEAVMQMLPNIPYEIVEVRSEINKPNGKALFTNITTNFLTSEQEKVLLSGEGDISIYPAQDFPYPLPIDIEIIALTAVTDNSDSLMSIQGHVVVLAKAGNVVLKNLFAPLDCRRNYGKVYIAGFGPGDPELLTVKAYRALENADIIFYDCLLDKTYLDNFKGEKISSGKRKDNHLKEQDEINVLLYKAAISGKQVVRIKGGDPLIFGRGGEEFFYLKKRFIDVEIIPGITSALAAAAIAGIPLTQRNISSSVAFGTGHPLSSIHIPDTDTIVFYMPTSNLHLILHKLIEAGRSRSTPVAIIENISLPLQRIITGTLNEFLLKTDTYHSPLLIIVGETVKLNYVI